MSRRNDKTQAVDMAKWRDGCLTCLSVAAWMGSNMAVLMLNKLLLRYCNFHYPVMLTFLHMASGSAFIWGLWACGVWSLQPVQSSAQFRKLAGLAAVLALAVLCANSSLKYLEVSMNQAIGAMTPAFTALFALTIQGKRESWRTYSALIPVVGGVIVASGVEPDLHVYGAGICIAGAVFRGVRAVLQAMLLQPHEKLDSISCLAYMSPVSAGMLLVLTAVMEPSAMHFRSLTGAAGLTTTGVLFANCGAAFLSNYFNMVVTKRTSALTIQVLGQCKGILAAIVGVLCFQNVVPVLGWLGYLVTCAGCIVYGRCKAAAAAAAKHGAGHALPAAATPLMKAGLGGLERAPLLAAKHIRTSFSHSEDGSAAPTESAHGVEPAAVVSTGDGAWPEPHSRGGPAFAGMPSTSEDDAPVFSLQSLYAHIGKGGRKGRHDSCHIDSSSRFGSQMSLIQAHKHDAVHEGAPDGSSTSRSPSSPSDYCPSMSDELGTVPLTSIVTRA